MNIEKMPVLSVKYKIPSPRNHYIIRKGLLERLNQMKQMAVTIVKAGAGSGKTTLLSVYIREQNPAHVKWITMDQSMNQMYLFWKYIIEGMEEELSGKNNSLKNCFDGAMQREILYQSIFFSARLLRYPIYREKNQALARQFLISYEQADDIMKNMNTEIVYIGILYEQGNQKQAESRITQLVAEARKNGNKLKIVEGALMQARFLYERKADTVRVCNLVKEAADYATLERIRAPYWFEKAFVKEIMETKRTQLENVLSEKQLAFMEEIVYQEDYKNGAKAGDDSTKADCDLTGRELEVLQEIAKGKTNKEIAEYLCISLATVKTHLINIYGKLGVNNRMAAANKVKNILNDN